MNSLVFTDRQWLWIAAVFYLAVAIEGARAQLRGRPHSTTFNYVLMALGYACQLVGLYLRGQAVGGCPLGNRFEIFQFTAWSATTLYFVVGVTFRSSILGYFTACLAAMLSFVSLIPASWDATLRTRIFGGNAWIEFHAALAVFSYGVFGLLALTSILFLLRNYSLKSKRVGGWFSFLPSIFDLEHISVRLLGTGVGLLTSSLAVGSVWWFRDTASADTVKIGLTASVWAAYALVLGLKLAGPLQAHRFAWTCVVLFGAALVSLNWVEPDQSDPAPVALSREAGP